MKKPKHEIKVEDLSNTDLDRIRSFALERFREQRAPSQVPLIIESFMAFLSSEGYSIKKDEK